jgi:hypothetical protein
MAYIFDPIRNTFVDDEDTSLGNKLALNDTSEEIIRQIDEQFGPGTVFPASELPPKENPYKDFEDRNPAADGGMMRQNFAAAGLALPALSYPITLSLAKILGVSTAGAGAAELGDRVTDYLKENPQVFNDPRFKAAALTFGINIPGVIAPDADEMEREAEKIREMTKPTGFPAETEDMPIKTGETTPPEIDTKESFPAEEQKLPNIEGFPAETQQLPIIFENKKVENVKKKFDKVIELYETTGPGGPKRAKQIDQIRNKKFADDVKNLIDNEYGGNAQALANDLKIERVRINSLFNKHGIKQERAGNKTIQNIFLKQDKDKLTVSDLTTNIKGNETYLIDRTKQRFNSYDKDKNKFLNYRDIAEIVGVNLPDKTAQDFFQSKLRSANKKIGIETKKGFGKEILYNLEDTISALTKTNIAKPVKGTGSVYSQDRVAFEKKIDNAGFGARTYVLEQIRDASKEVLGEETILRAGEQYGHAEALSNLKRYSKLFKNSNAADITTLVFQDPVLNVDVLQAYGSTKTGIEQKRQPFLNTLEKLIGKKATAENIQIANEALNNLNELNNEAKIQIKRFQKTNRFVRDQENRIPDYKLTLPKEGETFKSGFLNIDMSSIDPSVSVGRILEINPDAKTFSDLSKKEQNLYRENLRNQITDFLKYFYQESGVNREDILSLEEEILEKNLKSKVAAAKGGPIELSSMPRVNFNGGGAVGADEDFAKELEYFLLNPDAELPKADSYRETMNPVALLNDMIDPRNYAYYADRLAETGIRIGEFGARVLPALGQLTADLIRKPAFKVTGGSGQGYVQDYTDVMPSNIKGTGIFTDFLNNLVGTEGTKVITEKIGLDKLIKSEEQKQKDRRSTVGPKILADQVTLGAELTAPIFPGLKLLKAYAKNRKLPVNDTTKEVMEKEIDEVLSTQNLTRRDFLKATGAGGAVILAKMLGFGDELATTTKVAEKVAKDTVGGTYPPPYFFKLVDKIKFMGDDVTEKAATKDREVVKRYKEYEMSEDVATGEITIVKRNEGSFYDQDGILSEEYIIYKPGMADETTKGTPPPEYEEFTVRPDSEGKLKDSEDGLDSLEEILEEVGDPDSLTLKK